MLRKIFLRLPDTAGDKIKEPVGHKCIRGKWQYIRKARLGKARHKIETVSKRNPKGVVVQRRN